MNIKDEIFEAYGEMKAEQDLLAVGYTALLGTSMAAKSGEAALLIVGQKPPHHPLFPVHLHLVHLPILVHEAHPLLAEEMLAEGDG